MSEKLLPQGDVTVTPTLTNAQKYSPVYGFVPGVVVEIHTEDGERAVEYFNRIGEDYITCTNAWCPCPPDGEYGEDYHPILYGFDEIKSIRLLSGPWAVWQFAPSGAVGVVHDFQANFILFYNHGDTDFDAHVKKHMGLNRYTYLPAPWWWLEGQNGD